MNPLTNIRNVQKLNEQELQLGLIGKKSWHDEYKDSAWLFIGGLPYDLSEGDIICVFSQYGEPVNFNLVRDHKTGKSKGFAFLCYEDQRSTVLAVDNLNGIKILSRTIRVDHVKEYKIPKEHKDDGDFVKNMREVGCAPKIEPSSESEIEEIEVIPKKPKREGKEKKKKKKKKKTESSDTSDIEVKQEPTDLKHNVFNQLELKQEKFDDRYDWDKKERDNQKFRNGKSRDSGDTHSRYSRDAERENGYDKHRDSNRHRGDRDHEQRDIKDERNRDTSRHRHKDNDRHRHKDNDRHRDRHNGHTRDSDRDRSRYRD